MTHLINVDYIFDEEEVKEIFMCADLMYQREELKNTYEQESLIKEELNELYYEKLKNFA